MLRFPQTGRMVVAGFLIFDRGTEILYVPGLVIFEGNGNSQLPNGRIRGSIGKWWP